MRSNGLEITGIHVICGMDREFEKGVKMSVDEKVQVLKEIAKKLNEEQITWALGASMLLYFKGIVSDFNDIDLMIATQDVNKVRNLLSEMGKIQPPNPNPKYQTEVFMEFKIQNVDVDVMAGFKIVNHGKVIDCSLKKDQIVDTFVLDDIKIFMQSLELWSTYYHLMNREEKVNKIQTYLNRKKGQEHA